MTDCGPFRSRKSLNFCSSDRRATRSSTLTPTSRSCSQHRPTTDSRTYCVGSGFCHELSGELDTDFYRTYRGDPSSRIVGRSGNLSVMVDMSPLCTGHLLIASDHHYLSFAEVAKDHESEVKDVMDQVFVQYQNTFGEPIILEHGSSPGIDGSSCITHAHLHVLPLELDALHAIMTDDGLNSRELDGLGELAKIADQRVPYFYCADQRRHRVYSPGRTPMRRQYLRSVAGTLLGIPDPEWDYALVVRKDLFRITMSQVAGWRII